MKHLYLFTALLFSTCSLFAQIIEQEVDNNKKQYYYSTTSNEAELIVRVGDIDNLGFGYPINFNPFIGNNTSVHTYPWEIDNKDYYGTDRIMVVSSYSSNKGKDGYTHQTTKPLNNTVPITIKYNLPKSRISKIILQLMLDDFQAPDMGTNFQFSINGKRLIYIEETINQLNQAGPIGKLVQIGILPEDLHLFRTGEIKILIDDPITGVGDGFAIDFIRLLINPKKNENKYYGKISGVVKDEKGHPINGVLISINGTNEVLTTKDGQFIFHKIPIGLVTIFAKSNSYTSSSKNTEIISEQTKNVEIILKDKKLVNVRYIKSEIDKKGYVYLYNIHFETGESIPNSNSEKSLQMLANYIKKNPSQKIEIIGHTDNTNNKENNIRLSLLRAKYVYSWLKKNNVNITNTTTKGLGESAPISSNKTAQGRVLNRRVEIRIVK